MVDINPSIECEVEECKYQDPNKEYCTLNKIKVERNELQATTVDATGCGSFELE